MSMPLARYYTADDVRALPDDGNRYETVHGELLVTPAPGGKHQYILTRLIRALDGYLAAHGLEGLLTSPADISFDDATLVQPDLFIADLGAFKQTWRWADIQSLHLAIEIVSPSSAKSDRGIKRRLYQEQRIPEYWVVDVDQQRVEVWAPDAAFPLVRREQVVWRHPALDDDCTVDLLKLFTMK
jgi:Uma2 family endonuclease